MQGRSLEVHGCPRGTESSGGLEGFKREPWEVLENNGGSLRFGGFKGHWYFAEVGY